MVKLIGCGKKVDEAVQDRRPVGLHPSMGNAGKCCGVCRIDPPSSATPMRLCSIHNVTAVCYDPSGNPSLRRLP